VIALLGRLPSNTLIDWDLVVLNGLIVKGVYGREMYKNVV
jgi:threonine 3-dehydrogenase